MTEYHKINSLYKRDRETKQLIPGEWSIPEFDYLKKNPWVFTEKVDGMNVRVTFNIFADVNSVTFAGRTDAAQMPVPLVEYLESKFKSAKSLAYLSENFSSGPVVFYGEGYGPKIQNGGKYGSKQEFVLFDIRVGNWWLQRQDIDKIAEELDLDVVPVIGYGSLLSAEAIVMRGLKSTWGDFEAEGIVARPMVSLFSRNGQRIIAKIRAEDYRDLVDYKNKVLNFDWSDK